MTPTRLALPVGLLPALLAEFAGPATEAAALSGSYARGGADAWSDVDLVCYTPAPPARTSGSATETATW